ncbi:MAG TPA: hypothetical protein VGK72_07665 [Chthoniobacterales bacterium]|jgi:hypothetical protein
MLRFEAQTEPNPATGLLSTGVEIECNLHQIEHPEGRFMREDGTRYDVCVMDLIADPSLRPPTISRSNFAGDRADSLPGVIRLGNVRQSSFRLRLISPGAAFGTLTASTKPAALARSIAECDNRAERQPLNRL